MDKEKVVKELLRVLKNYSFTFRKENNFRLLITTILSQRTRDENSIKAAKNLFSVAATPQQILKLKQNHLERLIRSSGFYKEKAKKIRKTCEILIKDFKGKVPRTREELLKLYGVGYKTADIVLSYGFGIPTIAVDTHVNRIPKRIGIVDEKATVEKVKQTLEKYIKGKDRLIVNRGLILFGREICRPINPKCNICPMKKYCKYYKSVELISKVIKNA
jgi:endonuclease-3